ncbi:TetR/AcrR family transcriptional regulator (plasmid) [Sphingomonas paeninsulae]|uniref:TetR/AcrR family transcriptional regulator n=1 Tax=Sphingomonas paeninsulae TaxID=2319844 RepID=A0A494TE13_SPHPE|nr:TetR/AcrR family transcriptional regulator [Sphingomonas paeninsulae]AYJ85293.1 TetR/AcrR family transcriptional regulator [Sphingomonas paeninsulae]
MIKKASTRDRILDAATASFWKQGYHAVSVDVICAAAGVQKGSFYHAFPSKADLLLTALVRVRDADRSEIERIYATDEPIMDKFHKHMEWFGAAQRRLKAKYGFVPGTFNMVLDINVPASVLETVRAGHATHLQLVEDTISEILVAKESRPYCKWLASIIDSLIHGLMIDSRLKNSLSGFDTFPESVFALIGIGEAPVAAYSDVTAISTVVS